MKILTEWTHEGVTYRTGDEIVIKDRGTYIFLSFIEGTSYPVKYVNSLGGVDADCPKDIVNKKKKVPFEQRDYDNIMKIVYKTTGDVLSIISAGKKDLRYDEVKNYGYKFCKHPSKNPEDYVDIDTFLKEAK